MQRAVITALLLPLTEMGPSLHHALQDAERFGVRNFDAYLVEVEVDVGLRTHAGLQRRGTA